jgi:KaiC/GvpD/RAD55 family RecA-like ATPase
MTDEHGEGQQSAPTTKVDLEAVLRGAKNKIAQIEQVIAEAAKNAGIDPGEGESEPPKKHRYHVTELDLIPPAEWTLFPFIQKGGLNILSGEAGSGKSFLAISWAMEVAKSRPVIYIAAEDPSQYPERVKAWLIYHNYNPAESKFYLETLEINLLSRDKVLAIIEESKDLDESPALVVIDTYAAATAGADEINNGEIETILMNARLFIQAWNCAVLFVHHFNKSGTSERGGTGLKAGVVLAMKLHVDGDSIRLEFDKVRNASKPADKYFIWKRVELRDVHTGEIRYNRVPIESDIAVINSDLTSAQESILRWFAAELRRNEMHTMTEIVNEFGAQRTVSNTLNKLKLLGYVEQPRTRGAYKITALGCDYIDRASKGYNEPEPAKEEF